MDTVIYHYVNNILICLLINYYNFDIYDFNWYVFIFIVRLLLEGI